VTAPRTAAGRAHHAALLDHGAAEGWWLDDILAIEAEAAQLAEAVKLLWALVEAWDNPRQRRADGTLGNGPHRYDAQLGPVVDAARRYLDSVAT
jgi:hypothetical protein